MISGVLAVVVASAVSMKALVEQAGAAFAVAFPGEGVTVQAGASGVLVAQIEQGAPIQIFVSASSLEMDRLDRAHLLVPGTRHSVATNRLVLVSRKGLAPPDSLGDLLEPRFERVALGNSRTVPAGRYAEQALKGAGVLPKIAPRLIYGENVRQVLDYIVRGEVDAAIVYATEAKLAGDAVVPGPLVPAELHAPIVYEAALLRGDGRVERAQAFLDFLVSSAGQEIIRKHGFGPPASP